MLLSLYIYARGGGDEAAEAANGAVETLMDAGFHLN